MRTRLSLIAAALLSSALAFPVIAQEAPDPGASGQAPVVKPPQAGASPEASGTVQDGKTGRVQAPAQQGGQAQPDAAASDAMKQDGKAAGATQDEPASESAGADAMKKKPGQAGAESNASTKAEGTTKQTEGEAAADSGTKKTEGTAATEEDKSGTEGTASTAEEGTNKTEGTASTTEGENDVSRETTASVDINTEQRTEIRNIIVESAPEPADIDIDVSVGVEVPRTVTLRPLPPRVIEIVPQYERYQFFVLADGRIIIVDPNTYEIVFILAA
jgi:hypothetical protein